MTANRLRYLGVVTALILTASLAQDFGAAPRKGRDMGRQLLYVTEPELVMPMNALATNIGRTAASMDIESPHFIVLLFDGSQLGPYISDCDKASVVSVLRETADRIEGRLKLPGIGSQP